MITSVYNNITQFATLLNRELLSIRPERNSPSKASNLADEGAGVARDADKVFTALLTPPPSSQSRTKPAYVIGQWTFWKFYGDLRGLDTLVSGMVRREAVERDQVMPPRSTHPRSEPCASCDS